MKLRLPHKLQAALIAAFTAVAFTAQQAQAFSDAIWTFENDYTAQISGVSGLTYTWNGDGSAQYTASGMNSGERVGDYYLNADLGLAITFAAGQYLQVGGVAYWTNGAGSLDVCNSKKNDYTVMAWVKFDSITGDQEFFGASNEPSRGLGFGAKDGVVNAIAKYKDHNRIGTACITAGEWVNIAFSYVKETNTMTAYVNGVSVGTSNISSGFNATGGDASIIGGSATNADRTKFAGQIAELKILSGARDQAGILEAAHLTSTAPGAAPEWAGTQENHIWAETGVWKNGATFTQGSDTIFGDDAEAYKTVSIDSAISAGAVAVNGTYEFALASGGSLTATKIDIAENTTLTTSGSGAVTIGKLAGAGDLVKGDSGVMTISGNNSGYTGGITVNAGTLAVTTLGSGTLTVNEGGTIRIATRNSGTGLPTNLSVAGDGNLSLMTDQTGSGDGPANIDLKTISAKNLYLHAEGGDVNSYNSRFIFKSGSNLNGVEHLFFDGAQMWVQANMDFTHAVTFGATTYYESAAAFNKAALRVGNGSGSPVAKFSGPIEIQDTFKAGWQGNGELVFAGGVTGTAAIDLASFSGNGKFTVSGDASTKFSGTVTSAAAITLNVTDTGSLRIGSGSDLAGTVTLAGALTVNGAATISGNITGAGSLTKTDEGTLTLSGNNSGFTGATTVNGGTLETGYLGAGGATVNGGTLKLTSSVTTTGALTLDNNSTLVFKGENMLTADTLALGSGTVTFDLSNISVSHAGTITLATATTSASLGSANVEIIWNGLNPIFHYDNGVQVDGNSWIITLTADSQKLTWAGEVGDWSHSPEDTHWLNSSEQPSAFAANDTAIFAAGGSAVANIKEAITAADVEVREGANVTLRKAEGAETATLNALEMDIAGSLATSVDVTTSAVEATGAGAAWNITAGTVTADSISVAQDGKLALSGTGMAVKTVSGPGTVVVGDGFTLTLSQQIDSDQATDLSILNNGTVVVELGSSQNVINMDAASTGTLEVTAGTISSLSTLGANQTLKLAGGTVFAVKGSETAFASNISLAGNVAMQLKDSANATIAGAVSGEGKTLSVSGGGANQTVTFTDTVVLGGLNIAGGGEKLVFKGPDSSLGAIYAQNGAFTIQFSKAAGTETASYTFGTFAMSPTSSTGTRWLIVDEGVTVHGTGNSLDPTCTLSSAWGVGGGGLEVNGVLTTDAAIGMEANNQTAYIKGKGTINTAGLNFCNGSHTYIQGGITINITSNRGIFARSSTAAAGDVHLKDATLQALTSNWEFQVGRAADPVTLEDTSTGTTFDAAKDYTITLSKAMGGSGKLVKAGEGTVLAKGANTYSGGTVINAGKVVTNHTTALGTGNVVIEDGAVLEMRSNLTIAGVLSGTGSITYNNAADGTLSLTKNQTHQTLAMDIGSATGAGALNLTLDSDSDYKFSGDVDVNDINHHTKSTVFVLDEGDVTAMGKVLTGRLVVGETSTETGSVFTLSGENAMLVTSGDATEHTYGNRVQGYGTFKLEGGATQTLTGDLKTDIGFHGTFWADGEGSVLTIDTANIYGDQVTFMATDGGQIVLSSSVKVKETAVDNGTFDLNAAVETLNVTGESNTLNIGTGSVENISLGGDLKVAGNLDNFYIHSGNIGTVVTAAADTALTVHGTAHVDSRVEFHSSGTQDVKIAATSVEGTEQYALENDHFDVTAATVEKVATVDVEVANKVSAATVKNDVAGGTLSLTTGVDLEALKNVIATSGDIEFLNVDSTTQATLDTLNIAEGNTVSFSTDGNIGDVATEATVTVAGTLTAGTGATLNANLVMGGAEGSLAVLDVHAMEGSGGLNMGSSVTLNPGNVALSSEDMTLISGLEFGGMYDLFNGVDRFIVGENDYSQIGMADAWVNAKDVFADLALPTEKDYYLFYSGANQGGVGSNVGTIYIMQMPEPTTGTLSLLALCALAARRRRK